MLNRNEKEYNVRENTKNQGNESYTGTCACGNTKRENAAFISAEAQRKWSEKPATTDRENAMLDKNAKEKEAAETLLCLKICWMKELFRKKIMI